jgi:hypothetical protein
LHTLHAGHLHRTLVKRRRGASVADPAIIAARGEHRSSLTEAPATNRAENDAVYAPSQPWTHPRRRLSRFLMQFVRQLTFLQAVYRP